MCGDFMSKFANMLVMLNLLKSGRKYSIRELSDSLEVSERVIREYKMFLEEAGIYVESIRGPYGGYVLNEDVRLPNIEFDDKDVELLDSYSQQVRDKATLDKIKSLKNKLQYLIIDKNNKKGSILASDEIIKKYNLFSKALKYNNKLRIKYHNLQHGVSVRTVYPLSLYLFQGEWWSACYWEEKDDMRQFHLTRIMEIEPLEEKFDPNLINIKF